MNERIDLTIKQYRAFDVEGADFKGGVRVIDSGEINVQVHLTQVRHDNGNPYASFTSCMSEEEVDRLAAATKQIMRDMKKYLSR